jgi:hypothetical protein
MHRKRLMWVRVLVLALLLSGITYTVLAEQVLQSSSEVDREPSMTVAVGENEPDMDSSLRLAVEAGLEAAVIGPPSEEAAAQGLRMASLGENAADVDGYAGPRMEAPVEVFSEESTAAQADWSEFFAEPQADQDAGSVQQNDVGAAWSDFYYENVSGSTFTPRASVLEWGYPGGGCLYAINNPSQVLNVPLSLPQGSRIDYLRIYFFDTSAADSQAWVTVYDGVGGFTDLTVVSSAGTAGYGTALSPFVGHVVDNASRSYVLNWRPNAAGESMRLCGLRVAYRLP